MAVLNNFELTTVHTPVVRPRATRRQPLFLLRGVFWATSLVRNPELALYGDHLELQVPRARRCLVHRVRYERVRSVELVEGRHFTDVIVLTEGGTELVAPGIRNRDLAPAKPHLAALGRTRPLPARQA